MSGLVPNALYHARLVATNKNGTTFGPDITFTTSHGSRRPGAPTLGKTFNISPGQRARADQGPRQVHSADRAHADPQEHGDQRAPRHAVADHRRSRRLSPRPRCRRQGQRQGGKGKTVKTQKGTFGGAIFKLAQATGGASKGLATLTLVEGAFKGAPSYALCKKGGKKKAGDASAAAASSKVLQLLHASAKGKFKTTGKYSAATVRGTKWTIADRCDGTVTHDVTDSVAVTDFVRHKTIILHAGQTYVAKKP